MNQHYFKERAEEREKAVACTTSCLVLIIKFAFWVGVTVLAVQIIKAIT